MKRIKESLPYILEELEVCKQLSRIYTKQKKHIVAECLKETINPNYNGGYWTTEELWNQICFYYEANQQRRRHLEWIIKNIKNFAKST